MASTSRRGWRGSRRPGGICLSDRAHAEVRDRLGVAFADGGERTLKNIARPIRVWHWPATADVLDAAGAGRLALPDRPSIAVLPFDNMTSDPDQEYFADGIAEDLITALVAIRRPVRHRAQLDLRVQGQGHGRPRRSGADWGCATSSRAACAAPGNQVRVTAQLIEAATGRHVWAERYDRELADVFAAQDEVTEAIVAAIAPAVSHLERERVRAARCSCASMGAWENYQRGLWHVYRYSPKDIATAKQLFDVRDPADPQFAPAHAGQAYALFVEAIWGFVPDAGANLRKARQSAQRAVTLDARDAFAHLVLGRVLMNSGEVRAALTECRLALELNPNLAAAHFGLAYALTLAGRADEALDSVDRAIRLSPYDPLMHAFVTLKSGMFVLAGRYAEALETARDAQRKPNCTAWAHLHEASALANLGRLDEAKAAMDKAHALQPDISMRWVRTLLPAEPGVAVDAYFEGMKKAGLKD